MWLLSGYAWAAEHGAWDQIPATAASLDGGEIQKTPVYLDFGAH